MCVNQLHWNSRSIIRYKIIRQTERIKYEYDHFVMMKYDNSVLIFVTMMRKLRRMRILNENDLIYPHTHHHLLFSSAQRQINILSNMNWTVSDWSGKVVLGRRTGDPTGSSFFSSNVIEVSLFLFFFLSSCWCSRCPSPISQIITSRRMINNSLISRLKTFFKRYGQRKPGLGLRKLLLLTV